MSIGILKKPIDFLGSVFGTRSLIGFMNFLMWFGNTTIMLMAAIMGISQDVFEASDLDGCNSIQRFFDPSNSGIYIDHIHYWRTSDVRCSSDPDKWTG